MDKIHHSIALFKDLMLKSRLLGISPFGRNDKVNKLQKRKNPYSSHPCLQEIAEHLPNVALSRLAWHKKQLFRGDSQIDLCLFFVHAHETIKTGHFTFVDAHRQISLVVEKAFEVPHRAVLTQMGG